MCNENLLHNFKTGVHISKLTQLCLENHLGMYTNTEEERMWEETRNRLWLFSNIQAYQLHVIYTYNPIAPLEISSYNNVYFEMCVRQGLAM